MCSQFEMEAGLMKEVFIKEKLGWWNKFFITWSWIDETIPGQVEAGSMKDSCLSRGWIDDKNTAWLNKGIFAFDWEKKSEKKADMR